MASEEDRNISEYYASPLYFALCEAYHEWFCDNHHALVLGGYGDLEDLREALNAASAKALNSSSVAPIE